VTAVVASDQTRVAASWSREETLARLFRQLVAGRRPAAGFDKSSCDVGQELVGPSVAEQFEIIAAA
jgi:hypothetical protein